MPRTMHTLRPITNTLLQPTARIPNLTCRVVSLRSRQQQQRTFVTNPFSPGPQQLVATRTLHYPSKIIYSIISDVSSYSTFLPYCQESAVTKTSKAASDGNQYPEEAKLVIGFNNDVSEQFVSRVYCVPGRVVEAVSGRAETTLHPKDIEHHSPRPTSVDEDPSRKDTVMLRLLTRWTLRPYPYKPGPPSAMHPETSHKAMSETSDLPAQEKTEVNLSIDYQFANPVYAALSSAAAPRIAERMIDEFTKRVKAAVEGPSSAKETGKASEGILKSK